jgi:hypothetical protein
VAIHTCQYVISSLLSTVSTQTKSEFQYILLLTMNLIIIRRSLCDPVDGHLLLDGGYVCNLPCEFY